MALVVGHASSAPIAGAGPAQEAARLKLPAILSDNLVLQADKPLAFWGWSEPGAKVTVKAGADRR